MRDSFRTSVQYHIHKQAFYICKKNTHYTFFDALLLSLNVYPLYQLIHFLIIYNSIMGFYYLTVSTKTAWLKLLEDCFFRTGHHFGKLLRLICLAPADAVQVPIWCLNVIQIDFWVSFAMAACNHCFPYGMHSNPLPCMYQLFCYLCISLCWLTLIVIGYFSLF